MSVGETETKHRGRSVGKFCGKSASGKCTHEGNVKGDDYQKSAEGKKKWAGDFAAHHLLCVAEVKRVLFADDKLVPVVELTEWCINAPVNMTPLPLFPQTVDWYVKQATATGKKYSKAPPFKNLPQHDWDHIWYNRDVEKELKDVVANIQSVEGCDGTRAESLKGELNELAERFELELFERGEREGGTDNAWRMGDAGIDTWCVPFSMAPTSRAVSKKGYPARNFQNRAAEFIKLVQSLKG